MRGATRRECKSIKTFLICVIVQTHLICNVQKWLVSGCDGMNLEEKSPVSFVLSVISMLIA